MKRIHPRFPDYEIHDDGRVIRIRKARYHIGEVTGRILKSGYRQFKLVDANGDRVFIRANRLVAETFHGPAPSPQHQAAHNDGDKLNNAADNLRWATPAENTADQVLHGSRYRGDKSPHAFLTLEQVDQARGLFTGKRGQVKAIAERFGVTPSAMSHILRNKYYITKNPILEDPVIRTPTADQRKEILDAYLSQGFSSASSLAKSFGLSEKYPSALARQHGFIKNYRRGRNLAQRGMA